MKSFLLELRGDQLGMLEEVASAMEVSRSQALTFLVQAGFSNVWFAIQELRDAAREGGDVTKAVTSLYKAFGRDEVVPEGGFEAA